MKSLLTFSSAESLVPVLYQSLSEIENLNRNLKLCDVTYEESTVPPNQSGEYRLFEIVLRFSR